METRKEVPAHIHLTTQMLKTYCICIGTVRDGQSSMRKGVHSAMCIIPVDAFNMYAYTTCPNTQPEINQTWCLAGADAHCVQHALKVN